jgi:hypothetical protein
MSNAFLFIGETMKRIRLTSGGTTLVDDEDYPWLRKFKWHLTGDYVARSLTEVIPNTMPPEMSDADFYERLLKAVLGQPLEKVRRRKSKTRTRTIFMANEIMGACFVDHANHNTRDNQRCNLRPCTPSQNQQNRVKQRNPTTSRYKGVFWQSYSRRTRRPWFAQIGVNGKKIRLGSFDKEKLAAQAYDEAAVKYFGEFAYPNFPERAIEKHCA